MPITQGHGNPKWTEEETILALDLLYRHGKPLDRTHREVLELSELLKAAEIHEGVPKKQSFRNADGVALKLQNLLSAVEPGRGLSFSKTDRLVVERYPREKASELSQAVTVLRAAIANKVPDGGRNQQEQAIFAEGGFLTVRHRFRDIRLRHLLLKRTKTLVCEICDFAPPLFDRQTQECFFEAHHIVPLSQSELEVKTRLEDMSLLCAGCHRFIHRLISNGRRWISVEEARLVFNSGRTTA